MSYRNGKVEKGNMYAEITRSPSSTYETTVDSGWSNLQKEIPTHLISVLLIEEMVFNPLPRDCCILIPFILVHLLFGVSPVTELFGSR